MTEIAIKVEGLGKKYFIGHRKSGDFRNSFGDKLKEFFGRKEESNSKAFWALQDVDFEIKKGEAVGIIGRNGAGKSTLLKILSRITEPTKGRFEINGRVSSLLEVGTGFHPELSGRENIYLNGTILGMRKAEIRQKFDEIIAFSGVEKFIDTPVKHYSSGMKVRLAFSVAAHLEPEILIVDEVLAVGDAEFQKKCLGKMDEVSKNEGRTVLFVSHNMAAVSNLCTTGILLREGKILQNDSIEKTIDRYVLSNLSQVCDSFDLRSRSDRKGNGAFKVTNVEVLDKANRSIDVVQTGNFVIFRLFFDCVVKGREGSLRIDLAIDDEKDVRLGWFSSSITKADVEKDFNYIDLVIPKFPLGSGLYSLTYFITHNSEVVDWIDQAIYFTVEEGDFFGSGKTVPAKQSKFYIQHTIEAHAV